MGTINTLLVSRQMAARANLFPMLVSGNDRLPTTNDRLDDHKWTPNLPNENLNPNYSTPTVLPIPSDRIDLTLDHQPQAIGSTGLKQNDETGEDEQRVIDLTNKADKDHPTKCHEKLS